jgi:protein associated with RNAse G/E
VYVVEIDDRSWQNVQPLLQGEGLSFYIENGNIYVYDGKLIYQVIIPTE